MSMTGEMFVEDSLPEEDSFFVITVLSNMCSAASLIKLMVSKDFIFYFVIDIPIIIAKCAQLFYCTSTSLQLHYAKFTVISQQTLS